MLTDFFQYVEIKTKITSLFAFLMAISFLLYQGYSLNPKLLIVFFIPMFLFDLTVTAINNYIDTKSNHQTLQFSRKTSFIIIVVLLSISTAFGIYLVYLTDLIVLILGGICFICGILYTYGPLPISRTPLGEFLSGIFYGFFIPLIILYISSPQGTYFTATYENGEIDLLIKIFPVFALLMLTSIPTAVTANIMLANNICDLEDDIKVKRHTIPYYIGDHALTLFAAIYYWTYLAIIIMVATGILHWISLFSLLTFIPVQKNIKIFRRVQDKASTFNLSIKNYIIIMAGFILTILISFAILHN